MANVVISEDLLEPEATLRIQLVRLWHCTLPVTPERALLISILLLAADDLSRYRHARQLHPQRLYRDAFRWVAANDARWPMSFVNVCEALNLSAPQFRAQLLHAEFSVAAQAA